MNLCYKLSLASCALQNSVKDGDANKCLEKLDNGVQSFGDGNTEGVVTCLVRCQFFSCSFLCFPFFLVVFNYSCYLC